MARLPSGALSQWRIILYDRWTAQELSPAIKVFAPEAEFDWGLVDRMSFAIEMDSPLASDIFGHSMGVTAKLWRRIGNWSSAQPDFAGIVAPIGSDSLKGNQLKLTVFSPMWLLQARFLYGDAPGVAAPFVDPDPTTIIKAMLDYTNTRGDTHILAGSMPLTAPIEGEKSYGKKQQIYQAFMDMTGILGGIDLIPRYIHDDGSTTLMRLDTSPLGGARGGFNRNARAEFRMGVSNCDDCGYGQTPELGQTASFIHGEGDGGVPEYENFADTIGTIGLVERNEEYQDVQTFALVQALVDDTLVTSSEIPHVLTPQISPAKPPWYGRDYTLGDVIPAGARRGKIEVRANLRIYNAKLARSNGGAESTTLTLAPDLAEVIAIPEEDQLP